MYRSQNQFKSSAQNKAHAEQVAQGFVHLGLVNTDIPPSL